MKKLFSKKVNTTKEPSLLRKIIDIHYEQSKRRKALRELEQLHWGYDFLSLLLVDAAKKVGTGLQLTIVNKDGTKLILTYDKAAASVGKDKLDASILDNLDDDTAVTQFIREHSTR